MAEATYTITMSRKDQTLVYRYLMQHINEIVDGVWRATVRTGYNKAKFIAKNAVDFFYRYPKKSYHRTFDLYNAYDIGIKNGCYLSIKLGPELMKHYHHQGNDFVYENSFVKGYHGGSFGIDRNGEIAATPYWRTPAPFFSEWYKYPAPKSSSIRNNIIEQLDSYNKNTFIPLQKQELEKILIEVRDKLGV